MVRLLAATLAFGLGTLAQTAAEAATLNTASGTLNLDVMAEDLDTPWAFGFLPDGGVLLTEVEGTLHHLRADGSLEQVSMDLDVAAIGQGGLLDVMIPRDFATSREVFLSFAKPQGRGAGTALAVGVLSEDGTALRDIKVIFEMDEGSQGGRHFGSRIVEGADGTLFLTIGDRGNDRMAQDRSVHNGSIVRINRDGSIPADNPFAGERGVQPEIWSYGHRNPQGAALDLDGQLWAVEHGAQGGDEVNRVERGANYGWPVISYGRHYSGAKIGEGTSKSGMEQPAHFWDPSIAPSGMMVYSGKLWPEWQGDMFIGALKFDYISRLEGSPLIEVEQIEGDATQRVRDIREAPDGSIWFLSVGNGALYRLSPQ